MASAQDILSKLMSNFPGGATFVEAPMPDGIPPVSESFAGQLRGSDDTPLYNRISQLNEQIQTQSNGFQTLLNSVYQRHIYRADSMFDPEAFWPNDNTSRPKLTYNQWVGWLESQ